MADFDTAYKPMRVEEGGLVNNPFDKGGQTYAGISRKFHPTWAGWFYVDNGQPVPEKLVSDFYRANAWEPIKGELIKHQGVANTLFSYAVNAGVRAAVKLMQQAVRVTDDGIIGNITLYAINSMEPDRIIERFTLARVKHRVEVCVADSSQRIFLVGWLKRDLREGGIL